MLHLATQWPQQANLKFWPQAIDYSAWVFNRLPNVDTGLTPIEIWSSVRNTGNELARAHVLGCPVYVLDAALQDKKKIPKWNPRAQLGLFLGFSERHSSQVPLVLSVTTGKILPQYRVIFDDKFETVHSLSKDESVEQQWRNVLKLGYDCFLDTDFDDDGNQILPKYGDLIKDYIKAKAKREFAEPSGLEHKSAFDINAHQDDHQAFDEHDQQDDHQGTQPIFPPPLFPLDVDTIHGTQAPGGDNPTTGVGEGETVIDVDAHPKRNVGTYKYKDGPAIIRRLPIDGEEYEFAFNVHVISDWEKPVPVVSNSRHLPKSFHAQNKIQKGYLAECYLLQDSWFGDPTCVSELSDHIRMDPWNDSEDIYFNEIADP